MSGSGERRKEGGGEVKGERGAEELRVDVGRVQLCGGFFFFVLLFLCRISL